MYTYIICVIIYMYIYIYIYIYIISVCVCVYVCVRVCPMNLAVFVRVFRTQNLRNSLSASDFL